MITVNPDGFGRVQDPRLYRRSVMVGMAEAKTNYADVSIYRLDRDTIERRRVPALRSRGYACG